MKNILKEIKDGTFEKEWIREKKRGYTFLKANRKKIKKSNIEKITTKLNKLISRDGK